MFGVLAVVLFAEGKCAAEESDWGTLTGQIIVDGNVPVLGPRAIAVDVCPSEDVPDDSLIVDAETGGLCYAAVYLRVRPERVHPDGQTAAEPVVLQHIKDCRFTPHMVCLRTDQKLKVVFQDPLPHLVRYAAFSNQGGGDPGTDFQEFELTHPEKFPAKASCSFHPYMCAWWIVLDHPYCAVTDVRGRFTIKNLPVGDHELTIWHERVGYLTKNLQVTVVPGLQTLATQHFAISRFVVDGTRNTPP